MGSLETLLLTRGPSSCPSSGGICHLIRAKASLTSGYHPEANGQTERLNQQLETCLQCLVSQNPSTRSKHLVWVEYAHNSFYLRLPQVSLLLRVFMVMSLPFFQTMNQRCQSPLPMLWLDNVVVSGQLPAWCWSDRETASRRLPTPRDNLLPPISQVKESG